MLVMPRFRLMACLMGAENDNRQTNNSRGLSPVFRLQEEKLEPRSSPHFLHPQSPSLLSERHLPLVSYRRLWPVTYKANHPGNVWYVGYVCGVGLFLLFITWQGNP